MIAPTPSVLQSRGRMHSDMNRISVPSRSLHQLTRLGRREQVRRQAWERKHRNLISLSDNGSRHARATQTKQVRLFQPFASYIRPIILSFAHPLRSHTFLVWPPIQRARALHHLQSRVLCFKSASPSIYLPCGSTVADDARETTCT